MRTECPKCRSPNARYTKNATDLILKCLCGFHKVVFSTLEQIEVQHNDTGQDVRLPKLGSNLRVTLNVLSIFPEATSAEITERCVDLGCSFSVSDVSTYLTILRARGLVLQLLVARGVRGGSTWCISDPASDLMGV